MDTLVYSDFDTPLFPAEMYKRYFVDISLQTLANMLYSQLMISKEDIENIDSIIDEMEKSNIPYFTDVNYLEVESALKVLSYWSSLRPITTEPNTDLYAASFFFDVPTTLFSDTTTNNTSVTDLSSGFAHLRKVRKFLDKKKTSSSPSKENG